MPTIDPSRKTLLIWIGAIVAVGVVTFVLLGQSSSSPVRESGPSTTGTAVSGTADPTGTTEDGGGSTASTELAGGPDGTAAGQSAYSTYLGGDFDDTTPNTYGPVGADENGCDLNYEGACVPSPPAQVTCASIGVANFEIILGDPHGLDGEDLDGIVCDDESVVYTPDGDYPNDG